MSGEPITGLGVALATPFTTAEERDAKRAGDPTAAHRDLLPPVPAVDHEAFAALVRHVVDGGVDFVVVLGSTGEAATVTDDERRALVRQAVTLAGPVPVLVGVGHNSTEQAVRMARWAVEDGADGLLVVTPYYSRPQPAGIEAHFRAVAAAVPGTPIVAYNVPGRTGTNMDPATVRRLWSIPQVVGLKESSGDLRQIARICQEAPEGRVVLAGDDDLALASVAVGAAGLVSVCGNVAPAETGSLVRAALRGELLLARSWAARLAPLVRALSVETNPVPVKVALACLGLGEGTVRTPLAPAEPTTWAAVQQAVAGLGLGLPAYDPMRSAAALTSLHGSPVAS